MKRCSLILFFALVAGASADAFAHSGGHGHPHGRSRAHVGVYVGPSVGWSWHYPGAYAYPGYAYPSYSPYYYPYSPPVVVVPSAPTTYIERSQPEESLAPPSAGDWYYYCRKPEGYYPYVRQCPGGWQRVPAQPQQ
ncbi:hypothetical protein EDC30_12130 [Paucimonas lemoignei]|uniref:Proline-rich region n=1 Tax=Paucimonas lemoignei TaxID=29443 RepID=A0A4V2UI38_PAULE|nr:hypothetical protein [Paucimonas lemoignei]TCS32606.1 hypothetical protein EDC30_12130 [Paucimonas lemoignei]